MGIPSDFKGQNKRIGAFILTEDLKNENLSTQA